MLLEVQNLSCVSPEEKPILKGLNLSVVEGTVHAIMGPNGSGKSTLAQVLLGSPAYAVTGGKIVVGGEEITDCAPDERARKGMFLAFQYPQSVPGVPLRSFLKSTLRSLTGKMPKPLDFKKELEEYLRVLKMDPLFLDRSLNDGLSGGEKKKSEILQLLVLKPKLAILDETDSGLDVDALRFVCEGIAYARKLNPSLTIVVITHYQRILQYLAPDVVSILVDGQIVESGGAELAEELERSGYERFQR